MAAKVEIATEIGRGWELFKSNMGLLILVNLLAGVLALVTCGILAGPMMAGEVLIVQRLLKKDSAVPSAGDLFKGFEFFLDAFLFILVLGFILGVVVVIPGVNIVVGYVSSVFMWTGVMFVALGKMKFAEALKKVGNEITTGPFWTLILAGVVANLIGGLGVLACGIGVLFTVPLATCIIVCAYDAAYGNANADQPPVIES